MNRRQKLWITKMTKKLRGIDRHERTMEITAHALKLYENIAWTTWEIVEVENHMLRKKEK